MADDGAPTGVLGRLQASAGEVGVGAYAFICCAAVLLAVGLIGIVRKEPWVFPSLGPTVMLFFETPLQPAASADHAVIGHGVAVAVGWACLHAWGLAGRPSAVVEGLTTGRVLAAAASVAVTAVVLRAIRRPHPPAGATTLIVSLGILTTGHQLAVVMTSVVVVTVLAVTVNRLLGVDHPLLTLRRPNRSIRSSGA